MYACLFKLFRYPDDLSIHVHVVAKSRLLQLDGELGFYHDLIQSARTLHPSAAAASMHNNNHSSSSHSSQSGISNEPKTAAGGAPKPRNPSKPKKTVKKDGLGSSGSMMNMMMPVYMNSGLAPDGTSMMPISYNLPPPIHPSSSLSSLNEVPSSSSMKMKEEE
jgi:hypothetical protein